MILDVVKYPDKRLMQKSQELINFDENLHQLLDDMLEIMLENNGVGLAAIQVGIPKRLFIASMIPEDETEVDDEVIKKYLIEFINPEILEAEGSISYEEGCLSIPGFFAKVKRANKILIRFQDRFGNKHQKEFHNVSAVACQHEYDHLEGKVFIERLSYLQRKKFEKEWLKKKKNK
jgi:peptide deformylase